MEAEVLARGLKAVVMDETQSSFIDGEQGILLYQGYNIHDLAERSTFEETTCLLWQRRLPTKAELDVFTAQLKASRAVPKEVLEVIRLVKNAHPMDVLRTAISALAGSDPDVDDDSREAILGKGIRLTSQSATIVAAHARIREGKEPVEPHPTLSHAANFLYMLKGQEHDKAAVEAMDVDFILHADHEINASSFAARVTVSTLSDLHSAIVSGIGTLKGPLHGGAAEAVEKMVLEIGEPERAESYVKDALAAGRRIMGFGHRVYKVEDPRAIHLRQRAQKLGEYFGQPKWYQILTKVEEAMAPLRGRGIYVNVDFYSGAVYYLLGIPEDLYVSLFALGRMPGWVSQVLEQYDNNMLIRPRMKYVGPKELEYIPIEKR